MSGWVDTVSGFQFAGRSRLAEGITDLSSQPFTNYAVFQRGGSILDRL